MIEFETKINVGNASGKKISDYVMNCTNEEYQKWWPGTHLTFSIKKKYPGDLGNQLYFDEYIGKRRLKLDVTVVENKPGEKIVWQIRKIFNLPAWLIISFTKEGPNLIITHIIRAGFNGIGKVFDPILSIYLSRSFEKEMEEHAHYEFKKLAKMVS